ncbi:MAG: MBG domain-containing protein [Trueperaceae bacterium]|nr:MBG domain-containing protein [Trueperaceae bacterium]
MTANYDLSFASYEITARPATVVPGAEQGKVYGDDDPSLTFTTENLVGEDALDGDMGRDDGEDVGSYAFTLGTLANPNYDLSLVAEPTTFEIERTTAGASRRRGSEGVQRRGSRPDARRSLPAPSGTATRSTERWRTTAWTQEATTR